VHPSVPVTTYAEFIAYAKANPGRLSYASAGNGSIHHITTELFKSLAGISMVHVPYKGMGQAVPALLAGDVQVAFSSYTAMAQYAKAGTSAHPRQRRRQAHAGAARHPDDRRARHSKLRHGVDARHARARGYAARHRREAERRRRRRRRVAGAP